MKVRCILLVVFFFILFGAGNTFAQKAQITQTIRGTVIDAQSLSPLPGANIVLLGTSPPVGSSSDENGEFRIENVPIGRRGVQVTFLGYNALSIPNILVTSAKEVVLTISLEEKVFMREEIVIVAKIDKSKPLNQMATVSARTFSVEETSRYAGSFRDPARLASNFAGVSGSSDQRNDIIIRGNSPIGVLWRFDDLDIPNPNHFTVQGTNGGPISILNNNLLTNSGFYTGAFPAEYGNAIAGVFDLKMRNGNNEKREFIGQFGMNGAELSAEGPFSKKSKASYLLSYRYSTWTILDKMGVNFGASGIPKYQDLSFKVNIPTKKAGIFKLFGIGGISDISLLAGLKDSTDNSFGLSDNEDIVYGSDMGVAGISHTYFYNNDMYQKIILAISGSQRRVKVDTLAYIGAEPVNIYNDHSIQGRTTLSWTLNKKFNARHTVKTGFYLHQLNHDFDETWFSDKIYKWVTIRDHKGSTGLGQAFVQWRFKLRENVTLNSGFHFQYFTLNSSYAAEPRVGLKWEMSEKQSISFGYGYHSQLQLMEVYYYESRDSLGNTNRSNEHLGFTKSHHLMLGFDRTLKPNLRFKGELYYQYLHNVPVFEYSQNSFSTVNLGSQYGGLPRMDSLANKGTAYNYGAELTLEKFFAKSYYFLLTVSLYESKYRGSDDVERNTIYNSNYIFNLLGGKEFSIGKHNSLSLDAKFVYAGGKRYTPIDLAGSLAEGEEVLVDADAFSLQFDPYSRIDARLSFKHNAKKVTHEIAFDIQNIANRKNILLYQYNNRTRQIDTEYQLGIFPVALYRIEF